MLPSGTGMRQHHMRMGQTITPPGDTPEGGSARLPPMNEALPVQGAPPGSVQADRASASARRDRIASARPSTCAASCAAENATRRRAVPAGTVGGRMATTR